MGMSRNTRTRAPMLVGDIGATSTRLALAGSGGTPGKTAVFPTPDGDVSFLLQSFLQSRNNPPLRGCLLAVAGLIRGRGTRAAVKLTNRATVVSVAGVSRAIGCPVLLCNDLVALAAAVPVLEPGRDLQRLDAVTGTGEGTQLVVAVGTGFGAALITARGEIIPTEGGHVLCPLEGQDRRRIEDLLSGMALAARYPAYESATALGIAAEAAMPAAVAAVAEFSQLLGRACANLVLATGAWSGVFLAGGVIDALAPVLDVAALRAGFAEHPTFGSALARVPLVRVRAEHAALTGLATLGTE